MLWPNHTETLGKLWGAHVPMLGQTVHYILHLLSTQIFHVLLGVPSCFQNQTTSPSSNIGVEMNKPGFCDSVLKAGCLMSKP